MPSDHALRYGTNPHQVPASFKAPSGFIEFLNGEPSYINLMDILTGWQMTRELSQMSGSVSAVSMKHCTPVGLAGPGLIDHFSTALTGLGDAEPATSAYLRARSSDWGAAYGDIAVIFGEVDDQLAEMLSRLVSDGIAASGYSRSAIKILQKKKARRYLIARLDKNFEPPPEEERTIFGVKLIQQRNCLVPEPDHFEFVAGSQRVADKAAPDLALAATAMKYTVSNSMVIASEGRTLAVSAGQQSRILATKLACYKLDRFLHLQHPDIIRFVQSTRGTLTHRIAEASTRAAETGTFEWPGLISLASDGFLPFIDNIEVAATHGIDVVLEPEGANRAKEIAEAATALGITLVRTSSRYFYH